MHTSTDSFVLSFPHLECFPLNFLNPHLQHLNSSPAFPRVFMKKMYPKTIFFELILHKKFTLYFLLSTAAHVVNPILVIRT